MSLEAARLFANVGLSGAASTIAGLRGVGAQVNATHTGLGRLGGAATSLSHNLTSMIGPLGLLGGTVLAGGLVGGLAAATKSAMSFQAAMELIRTQAGATQGEVDTMSAALLKLAPKVGTGPEALAQGLYHVESAGMRGARALDILTIAAEGAKVGHADLESVTNALIAAVQSGVGGVQSMSGAMGTLNAIVGAGNMRMQDLADAMGTGVLSTAKNYGVTIQSVGAALASMTDQGIPAIDAATRLNSAMRLMAAPTSKAKTELKSIGLSSMQLALDMRGPGGILAAIEDLRAHLDKSKLSLSQQAALIAAAFGGKQSGAILTLIGNVELLKKKQEDVNAGAAGFGAAWAASQQTAQAKLDRFQAVLGALAIRIGNVFLPVLTDAMSGLTDFLTVNADKIQALAESAVGFAKSIGQAFQTFIVPAIGALASAWGKIPDPLKAALVGGFVVNKATGGLLTGLAGDALKGVGLLGSRLPGPLGKVAGALTGAPVYVTNWPAGFGGGLNPGNLLPEVTAGAGFADTLAGAIAAAGPAIFAGGAAILFADAWLTQNNRGPMGSGFNTYNQGNPSGVQSRNPAMWQRQQQTAADTSGRYQRDESSSPLAHLDAAAKARNDAGTRHYSNTVAALASMVKAKPELNANAVLPALQALNSVFVSSNAASATSVANAVRIESALQARATKDGNSALAAVIGTMKTQLLASLTTLNGTIVALPGQIAAAGAFAPGSAALQGAFLAGEHSDAAGGKKGGTIKPAPVHLTLDGRQLVTGQLRFTHAT